jgi:hypothetical protein
VQVLEGEGMSINYEKLRERLVMAFNNSRAVYEADKGKPIEAFNSGRYDGLKEAIAIVDQLAGERGRA